MKDFKYSKMLEKVDITLDSKQIEQFNKYQEILVEWNKVMNLTAITEYDDVWIKHFVDSLSVQKAITDLSENDAEIKKILNFRTGVDIIDVGTGAGFPGLPLKIAFPETKVTLLDSLNKRINFLNTVTSELSLGGISAIHSRAEEGARKNELREKFTVGVSRAVASLSVLSEYVLPFIKIGGYFIAYKSGNIEKEMEDSSKAIEMLGGKISHVYKFTIPDTDIERSFIFIKKVRNTSKKYPRKAGLPSKEPL